MKIKMGSLGRQINRTVKVGGGQIANGNFNLSRKNAGLDVNVDLSGAHSRNMSFVDDNLGRNGAYTNAVGISIAQFAEAKDNFNVNTNVGISTRKARSAPTPPFTIGLNGIQVL
jgi:hypothetical protein